VRHVEAQGTPAACGAGCTLEPHHQFTHPLLSGSLDTCRLAHCSQGQIFAEEARTMAIAGQCSSCYYTSPTLQLHRRHSHLPRQPQAARRARRPRLQVAAAADSGPIRAATDAEFFQPSDTRPIMLFDGAHPPFPVPSASWEIKSPNLPAAVLCACRRLQPLQRRRPLRAGARPQQV
jgi:hypothetical protein